MPRKLDRVRLANLEILVEEAGTAAALARRVGTNESYLSQIRRQLPTAKGTPRGIGDDLAEKLERGMGKPTGWMDEQHISMEALHAESQRTHGTLGRGIFPEHPLISWAQAGRWSAIVDSFDSEDAEDWLPCPLPCSRPTFILRVQGESMEPRFQEDDLIFVDPEVAAEHGSFVVLQTRKDEEAVLRRLIQDGGRSFLEALNPAWPNRIVEMGRREKIIGVVIFKGEVMT